VAPELANPVAGQAAIVKTRRPPSQLMTAEEVVVKPVSAMIFDLGELWRSLHPCFIQRNVPQN